MTETAKKTGAGRSRPRASLAVRVAVGVLAALALCLSALAAVNLSAVLRFNEATAGLNEHLDAAAQSDVDLDALAAGQQQTDAQFDDAAALEPVLLPMVREAIESNRETSATLTKRVNRALREQKGDSSSSADTVDGSGSNAKKGDGLTDEQKQQVEDLLKANQQSTPSQSDENGGDSGVSKNDTVKPW